MMALSAVFDLECLHHDIIISTVLFRAYFHSMVLKKCQKNTHWYAKLADPDRGPGTGPVLMQIQYFHRVYLRSH